MIQLPQSLDENVLAELLGLGLVAQPAVGRHVDNPPKPLEELLEGVAAAALGRQDQLGHRLVRLISFQRFG